MPVPVISHAPTRPVETVPHLRQVSRGHVNIVSIYPARCTKTIRHNGSTTYTIEAAPRGSYSMLTVYDTQEWCKQVDAIDGKETLTPMPIPAEIVATDLVRTWAGDTLGKRSGYEPGIAIIPGDAPTEAELLKLREQQSALFNWYITTAMGLHIKGQGTEITDIHRLAAREMLDKGAEKLPWFPTVHFTEVKNCVACNRQIESRAIRCEHCTTILPQFCIDMGIEPVGDPIVTQHMDRIRSRSKSTPIPKA